MDPNERTERLINTPVQNQKPSNKNKILIAIIAVLVCVLVVLSYFIFKTLKGGSYEDLIADGDEYLHQLEYDKAKEAYESAIGVKEDGVEAYNGLAIVAYSQNDPKAAQDVYNRAFEATGLEEFKTEAEWALYGNSGGNITNAGNVVSKNGMTFVGMPDQGTNIIYKIQDNRAEALVSIGISSNTPGLENFNMWGDKLYYTFNNTIQTTDLRGDVKEDFSSEEITKHCRRMQIYNGILYFLCENDGTLNGNHRLYSCDLSKQDHEFKEVYQSGKRLMNFFISDDHFYIAETDDAVSGTSIVQVNLDGSSPKELLYRDGDYIPTMVKIGDRIYFNIAIPGDDVRQVYLGNEIDYLDVNTGQSGQLSYQKKVTAVNSDGKKLFYRSVTDLCACNMDGTSPQTIGNCGNKTTSSICLSTDRVFLTTTEFINPYTIISTVGSVYSASLTDLSDFGLYNPGELIEVESETASDSTDTVKDGVYVFRDGEYLSYLNFETINEKQVFDIMCWHKYGESSSDYEYFDVAWEGPDKTYTVEDGRGSGASDITITPKSENDLEVTIKGNFLFDNANNNFKGTYTYDPEAEFGY